VPDGALDAVALANEATRRRRREPAYLLPLDVSTPTTLTRIFVGRIALAP
jgi:hypothetical protein